MTAVSMAIRPAGIACRAQAADKDALIDRLAQLAQTGFALPAAMVGDALRAREAEGNTGCGEGIAIPHAKLTGLQENILLFCSLEPAIDYASPDNQAVDLVFALLSNAQDGAAHLRHLAEIARYARVPENLSRLRGAGNRDALYALLTESGLRRAA